MNNIFISYSRRNVASVERLSRDLQDAGFNVWVDFRRIPGGAHWQEAIFDGIRTSDIVIPCLSPDAVNSEWVRREIAFAQEQDKRIIPIQLRDVFDVLGDYEELRPLLDIQIINFASLGYERAYPTLLGVLPGNRAEVESDDPDSIPNPFKGLESFTETDSDIFFGRDDLVQRALDQLQACVNDPDIFRFLAVIGASGSGKSSVVRAGIVPAIRRGALPGSARFPVITIKPGSEPTNNLAQRLNPLIEEIPQQNIVDAISSSPSGLHQIGGKILETAQGGTYIVLLIDQFEELFTQTAALERRAFLDMIYDAVTQPDGYFLVVITMRADFFDRLSHYNNLASLFEQNNLIIVSEMTADNQRRSIEGPARTVGLDYEQGLPDKILEEVLQQPGSLPLLQYMLTKLYEKRNGAMLTWAAYDEIGGVRKALAQHAEDVYRSLEPAEQDLTKRVLLSLVEVDESGVATRRRLRRRDLSFRYMSDTALNALLDKLTSPEVRLLVTSRQLQADDEEEQTVLVEVVHEALIREWSRFQNWITENQENLRISTEVLQDAQDWENADHDPSYLLTSSRLDRAVLWLQDADATDLQRRFIQASEEEAEKAAALEAERTQYVSSLEERSRQRLRLLVFALSIFLILAAGLAAFGWISAGQARVAQAAAETSEAVVQANAASARSRALAQEAEELLNANNSQLAVSLGIEANSIPNPPPVAQNILSQAAYRAPRLVLEYDSDDPVYSVTYSINPDNPDEPATIYAAGAGSHAIIAWDALNGERIGDELTEHDATVRSVVAHNQEFLVSGDENGEIILWNLPDRSIRWRGQHAATDAQNPAVLDIAINGAGTRLVSAGADGTIRLWNAETGEQLGTFGGPLGHDGAVLSVAFSPEGSRIVSGGTDTRVLLWAANTPVTEPFELDRHRSWVQDIQFTRDGNAVISGSSDSSIRIYDIRLNQRIADIDQPDRAVRAVAISPDGSAFAAGTTDNLIKIWDINTRAQRHEYTGHTNEVYSLAYSPLGDTLLSGGSDGKVILWDAQPGPIMWRAEGNDQRFIDAAYSPDGAVAVGITTAGTLVEVDTATGEQLNRQDITTDTATSIAYSPNGETALVGTLSGDLLVLDPGPWAVVERFEGYHTDPILALAYSPDGRSAATGDEEGNIILWDIETETLVHEFNSEDAAIWSITFTPNGENLIYSVDETSENGVKIYIRNIFSDTKNAIPAALGAQPERGNPTDTIRGLAVSNDGQTLLSASDDGRLILWDITRRAFIEELEGHAPQARVLSVAFSPDDRYAVSADDTGEIIMWNIASGQLVRRLDGHTDLVNRVRVHPSGQMVLSASADSAMLLWRIYNAAEQITWAVENRDEAPLTCEDRARYAVAQTCPQDGTPTLTPSPLPTSRALAFAVTPVSPVPPAATTTPTPTLTPSVTPTPTVTATPTATPVRSNTARIGTNRGNLPVGGTDIWQFEAEAGRVLSIEVIADNPARNGSDDTRNPNGLDSLVELRISGGGLLAENDDRQPGVITDSLIVAYAIEIDGTYEIHVTSWDKQSGGEYTLIIEDLS